MRFYPRSLAAIACNVTAALAILATEYASRRS